MIFIHGVTMNSNSQLVYSTASGSICPKCQKPKMDCNCTKRETTQGDGIIQIQKSTKGRKGKTVTLISGIQEDETTLKNLAKTLKQLCGSGGSMNDGTILIQGEHCTKIKVYFEQKGYKVKD